MRCRKDRQIPHEGRRHLMREKVGVDCKERGVIYRGVERGETDGGGGWECREKRRNGREEE